jgi:transposase
MKMKSKSISGLKFGKDFTWGERERIVKDYLSSGQSKQAIWAKYTGQHEEHGQLLKWMRVLGYQPNKPLKRFNLASTTFYMKKKTTLKDQNESFEELQLKKRIIELEKQLKDAEIKAIAYSTMVDVAEKEFNISIRKKYNTKPLKK